VKKQVPAEVQLLMLESTYAGYCACQQRLWRELYGVMCIRPMQESAVELIWSVRMTIDRLKNVSSSSNGQMLRQITTIPVRENAGLRLSTPHEPATKFDPTKTPGRRASSGKRVCKPRLLFTMKQLC